MDLVHLKRPFIPENAPGKQVQMHQINEAMQQKGLSGLIKLYVFATMLDHNKANIVKTNTLVEVILYFFLFN